MNLENVWHLLPVNDLEEHNEHTKIHPIDEKLISECKCKPGFIYEPNGVIVVHNSFDGREGVEQAKKILYDTD